MKIGPVELGEPIMEVKYVPTPALRQGKWWERLQRWVAVKIERWSVALAAKARNWQHRGEWQ